MKKLSDIAYWRHKRHIRKKWKHLIARKKLSRARRRLLAEQPSLYTSQILTYCQEKLIGKTKVSSDPKFTVIKIPKKFSFFDDPDAVLNVLRSIIFSSNRKGLKQLFFDHLGCDEMDLGASVVMDVLAIETLSQWRVQRKQRFLGGKYPKNNLVAELLEGSGIVKHLGVARKEREAFLKNKYIYFPLWIGKVRTAKAKESSDYEAASSELAEYFNKCLKTQGFELTREGFRHLTHMTGELLANAEEHSGSKHWYVIGYMRQAKVSGPGELNLAIFNFGNTIYETLTSPETSLELKKEMEQLSTLHEKGGFFSKDWSRENLWTLYSLQEGVTRFRDTPKGKDRGVGTIKMIDFFQKLGQGSHSEGIPKMCLISGSTYILFDGRYQLGSKQIGNETRQLIAFNSKNDLAIKPDQNSVKCLEGFFPGTLISMRFFLDRSFLSGMQQVSNERS